MNDLKILSGGLGLHRDNLKDQAVRKLRSHIISGVIRPGTQLVERDLAELLGISRGPTREALLELETQGLVENLRGRRRVIEPSTTDLVAMLAVRSPLETRAAELAARGISPAGVARLTEALEAMKRGFETRDRGGFVLADVAIHEAIWHESGNVYLEKALRDLSGPIFLAIVHGSLGEFDWAETLELHRGLVESITGGDEITAGQMACRNMDDAVERNAANPA